MPPVPGPPPPADRESFRHSNSTTMADKAGQRMRNVEKKSAEMAAKVEQACGALASAEENRDANEKSLAEARSHFHKKHFARDNDVGAGHGVGPVAAAGIKEANGNVGCVRGQTVQQTNKPRTCGSSTASWKRSCSIFVEKWEPRRPSAEKTTWPARRQESCKQVRRKPLRRLHCRRIFDQSHDNEEVLSSEQEPECISILCANITFWRALEENSFCINAMTVMLCHLLSRI